MLANRITGLRNLQILAMVILAPIWFGVSVVIGVEWFGRLGYDQVNFPLYLLGVVMATVVSHQMVRRDLVNGTPRYQWIEAIRRSNFDIGILAFVLFAVVFATKDRAISRVFLSSYLLASWFVYLLANRFAGPLLTRLFYRRTYELRTVLVGSLAVARRLETWALSRPPVGVKVVGVVNYDREESGGSELPRLGNVEDLESILEENDISQVVLLESRRSQAWVRFVHDTCLRSGCRLLIFNQWQDYFDEPIQLVDEGEFLFFSLRDEPLQDPLNRIFKRLFDLLIAIPVVLLLLPLLCLVVKVMQLRQSPGPLFFIQERTGHQKRTFRIYKFRSMHAAGSAEQEGKQARRVDPRVFPFGSFLRRTSLDEFPQFVNVLLGNMSVVGPRPHLVQHDEAFARLVEIYRTRHFVKPGITGLAQVKGFRGEITDEKQIRERIRLDLEYIFNYSPWLDLGIVLKTGHQLIFPPKSAY